MELKVAGKANKRKAGPTKAEQRLDARRADYTRMTSSSNFRAPEGAYHRPGSNKK